MPIDKELPVIAVFGSNKPGSGEVPAARLLGAQVNQSGAVLLTGGDGSRPSTVKDAAILAADAVGIPDNPATWVGVRNRSQAEQPAWRGPKAVVVTPGWDHRRNFVEACLCDAAIAIGSSSAGTASEALFCLYLGRPVVIVRGPSETATDARGLRELSLTRILQPLPSPLAVDLGISKAYAWADDPNRHAEVQILPEDQASAAELVTGIRNLIGRPSPRPDFDALVNQAAWDEYVRAALHHA